MKRTIHAVGVIFENSNKEILILRRNGQKVEGETWGLVGGKIDVGEDKYQAAVREVKEEIGVNISPNKLVFLNTYDWVRQDGNFIFETFRYHVADHLEIDLHTTENIEFRWALPEAIYPLDNLMTGLYPILRDEYNL